MAKKRIGLFGGVFDPPHIAHLIAAERAREEFKLDKIIFIPTNVPPHKPPPVASSLHRVELIKRAVEGNPYFEVLEIEIKRGGVSYTVDTIKEIKEIYGVAHIFLLIGMDEALDFMRWKEPGEILRVARFIIFTRSGFKRVGLPKLLKEKAYFINLNLELSSSTIRRLVSAGNSIRYLVPDSVGAYIKENGLYKRDV